MKHEIKQLLTDPEHVLDKLGILHDAKRQRDGYKIVCPVHGDTDPSLSIRTGKSDGQLTIKCFGCDLKGDVYDLIAAFYGLSVDNNFTEILNIAADMAGVSIDDEPTTKRRPLPKRQPVPIQYPPVDELRDMWEAAVAVTEDDLALSMLSDRGINIKSICDLCRVIPKNYDLPSWAIYRDDTHEKGRYDWIMSGHRLIIPLYNHEGKIRSFKARCITGGSLKNVNPQDYSPAELCMANEAAQNMMADGSHADVAFFCEGEMDFLSLVSCDDSGAAIFGIYSGAWSGKHTERLNTDRVIFLTDNDDAGDAYKMRLFESIRKGFEK